MTTIAATPASLAQLITAKTKTENELRQMRRINSAFQKGLREFLRRGYSHDDYDKFATTIKQHPDYGPVPFPFRLIILKMAKIEQLGKEIIICERLLQPHRVS